MFLWAIIGMFIGLLVGLIPGAGPFVAIALSYPFLAQLDPATIMLFYISVLIATNYTNSVTAILYGIPGDAAAISTAKDGHRLFRKGFGSVAISSNAIASTIGVFVTIIAFILLLPNIMDVFKFYNSIFQVVIISLCLLLIVLFNKQNKFVSILLFLFGGLLAKIGIDPVTFETFGTFGITYLTLGIPFSAVMIGLYIWPEILKMQFQNISQSRYINKFVIGKQIWSSSLLGSFVGFWSGLIPGVTNILGSYASAKLVKKYFKLSAHKSIAAAEAANNSGALSSLLPLLILAIPITGSEVLIYYLMINTGFQFNTQTAVSILSEIVYIIPAITLICFYISWHEFNLLGKVAYVYKKYKNYVNAALLAIISLVSMSVFPFKVYFMICLLVLMILGSFIKRWDTTPIIYGFFLSDLFYENIVRTIIILS